MTKVFIGYAKGTDVVTVHSLALLPIGVLFKKTVRTKLVYDAHEFETEKAHLKGLRKRLSRILEKKLIKYCDRVIVVSGSIAVAYKELYPDIMTPALVLNTPPYSYIEKKNLLREELGIENDKPIFLYQGGLSQGRGIEILLDTFKEFWDEKGVNAPVIVFMGYGPLEKEVQKRAEECGNIFFHPAVNPDVLLEYTASADYGISMIEDTCLSYRYCLPNKLFEYLMAGLPVIVSNLPEMKRLVEEYKLGVVAQENTAEGLKEAVGVMLVKGRTAYEDNIQRINKIFNWEEQEKVLLDLYRRLFAN